MNSKNCYLIHYFIFGMAMGILGQININPSLPFYMVVGAIIFIILTPGSIVIGSLRFVYMMLGIMSIGTLRIFFKF